MRRILFLASWLFLLYSCASTKSSTPSYDIAQFEEAITAFEAIDQTAKYHSDAIVFTGSSSIRFWKSMSKDFDPIPTINRGFGGSTLPEVNYYYDRIVAKYQPSIIVLYCGENDLWFDRSVKDVVADYRMFISKTKKRFPEAEVVFVSIKPSPSRWPKWKLFQEANRQIKSITERDKQQYYVDITEIMLDDTGAPKPDIFISDKLHMNQKGYDLWSQNILPVIQKLYKD